MNSHDKGHLAFLKVEERAIERGALVSKPTREESRYDAIIDWQGRLYRAQIKWAERAGHRSTGSVDVDLRKITGRRIRRPFYTKEEIDVLLLYLPAIDKVLWLGPEQFHERSRFMIRYAPARNRQVKKCLLADQFVW